MRISDWSSDVCSSDLFLDAHHQLCARVLLFRREDGKIEYRRNRYRAMPDIAAQVMAGTPDTTRGHGISITLSAMDATRFAFASQARSEEHTSELQSLMRISYAVFCLKKKKNNANTYYRLS